MDRAELESHYRQLTTEQLRRIALFEVQDLRDDAVAILEAEIRQRGLTELLRPIAIQRRPLTDAELRELVEWFRETPCPQCEGTGAKLNACQIDTIAGTPFTPFPDAGLIAGCPGCLETHIRRDSRSARGEGCLVSPLGWVGIATSLATLPDKRRRFDRNTKTLDALREGEPTEELLVYVSRCSGQLVLERERSGRSRS